jgi:hypothetical protein
MRPLEVKRKGLSGAVSESFDLELVASFQLAKNNGNVFNPPVITEPSGVIVKLEFNLGDTIDGQPVSGTFTR